MKNILYIIAFCSLLVISGCGTAVKTEAPVVQDKLPVVVSFHAMGELARAIGGDKVDVRTIIPDGEEPHEFQPKATNLIALSTAKVFIVNGLGLESWTDKALQSIPHTDMLVVTASDGTDPIHVPMKYIFHHDAAAEPVDPHVWLSLNNAKIEARNICNAYSKADPDNAAYYEQRYAEFTAKADDLTQTYESRFASSRQKNFVTSHAAFAYMARDFGLTQKSLTNVFGTGEPSARSLTNLSDFCKAEHIKVIFVENMESPKIAETLADDTGAVLEELNTMESSEGDKDYFTVMNENLEKIAASL